MNGQCIYVSEKQTGGTQHSWYLLPPGPIALGFSELDVHRGALEVPLVIYHHTLVLRDQNPFLLFVCAGLRRDDEMVTVFVRALEVGGRRFGPVGGMVAVWVIRVFPIQRDPGSGRHVQRSRLLGWMISESDGEHLHTIGNGDVQARRLYVFNRLHGLLLELKNLREHVLERAFDRIERMRLVPRSRAARPTSFFGKLGQMREEEGSHVLRIGRPPYVRERLVRDGVYHRLLERRAFREMGDAAVVHEEPAAEWEGVGVRFGDAGSGGGGANVAKEREGGGGRADGHEVGIFERVGERTVYDRTRPIGFAVISPNPGVPCDSQAIIVVGRVPIPDFLRA